MNRALVAHIASTVSMQEWIAYGSYDAGGKLNFDCEICVLASRNDLDLGC